MLSIIPIAGIGEIHPGDELAVVQAAAEEVRKVAEASNSDALRKRADELDAAVQRLKEKQGGAVATATPTGVSPTQPGRAVTMARAVR